jgi:hypothetical protein
MQTLEALLATVSTFGLGPDPIPVDERHGLGGLFELKWEGTGR